MSFLSGELLKKKAEDFWKFIYGGFSQSMWSDGWLTRFKRRFRISLTAIHGESGSVNNETIREQLEIMRHLANEYDPADIYNCDKPGLNFKHKFRNSVILNEA